MNRFYNEGSVRAAAEKKVLDIFGDGSDFESSLDRMWCSGDSLFQRVKNARPGIRNDRGTREGHFLPEY